MSSGEVALGVASVVVVVPSLVVASVVVVVVVLFAVRCLMKLRAVVGWISVEGSWGSSGFSVVVVVVLLVVVAMGRLMVITRRVGNSTLAASVVVVVVVVVVALAVGRRARNEVRRVLTCSVVVEEIGLVVVDLAVVVLVVVAVGLLVRICCLTGASVLGLLSAGTSLSASSCCTSLAAS